MSGPSTGARRGWKHDPAADEIRAAAADIVVAAGDTAALTHDALADRTGLDPEIIRLYHADIDALLATKEPGIEGVVVGRALYDGRIDVAEALRRTRS